MIHVVMMHKRYEKVARACQTYLLLPVLKIHFLNVLIEVFIVPLVSRILPSDVCKIHKSGCSIRLDTTLVDFSDMRWERGDISFIFRGDKSPKESLTVLDNEYQCYQRVRYEESEQEIEDEVDILMSSDILAAQMSTKSINFVRAQSGWIFREDKKV